MDDRPTPIHRSTHPFILPREPRAPSCLHTSHSTFSSAHAAARPPGGYDSASRTGESRRPRTAPPGPPAPREAKVVSGHRTPQKTPSTGPQPYAGPLECGGSTPLWLPAHAGAFHAVLDEVAARSFRSSRADGIARRKVRPGTTPIQPRISAQRAGMGKPRASQATPWVPRPPTVEPCRGVTGRRDGDAALTGLGLGWGLVPGAARLALARRLPRAIP